MIVYLGGHNIEKISVGIRCNKCKKLQLFEVNIREWYELLDYINQRTSKHIQEIIPLVSDDIREVFISGICGKCFDEIFEMVVSNID